MPSPKNSPDRSSSAQPDLINRNSAEEDMSLELQQHQQRLLDLKRQQEEVERRKMQLEELNQRRREVYDGQKMLKEKFNRSLTILERAEYDARKEVEQIQITRQQFAENLQEIEAINPHAWNPEHLEDELTRALTKIDHARSVYTQSRAKIDALSEKDISGEDESFLEDAGAASYDVFASATFGELVRRGFAFSLPLLVLLIILAALFLSK